MSLISVDSVEEGMVVSSDVAQVITEDPRLAIRLLRMTQTVPLPRTGRNKGMETRYNLGVFSTSHADE